MAPCLRNKPLSDLLAVRIDPPRFLPGFAPFVDGTVIVNPSVSNVNETYISSIRCGFYYPDIFK